MVSNVKEKKPLKGELSRHLGIELGHVLNPENVLPYVQRHEFEDLLLLDVNAIANTINATNPITSADQPDKILSLINDASK